MPAVPSFEMVSSIPLLRMFHERAARAFYVDYLGFEMEWEHRFHETPDSPLYFQLRLAEAVIHLNAHAQPEDPPAEVRIPVRGIEAFFDYLPARASDRRAPVVVDPRRTGCNTDLNLDDPSGNTLTFWEPLKN